MSPNQLLQEITDRHGEYLEMNTPEQLPNAMINILASMVIKERSLNEYYRKRLEYVIAKH